MKRILTVILLALILIAGRSLFAPEHVQEPVSVPINGNISASQAMTVIGFYALGDNATSSWTNLFGQSYPTAAKGNTDIISELALGWYSVDKQGNLLQKSRTGWQRPANWETVLNTAKQYKLQSEMVIMVTDGDGTISSLINDPAAMTRAVKAVSEEARLYSGVNLDFEGLGYKNSAEELQQVQPRFTKFVKLLDQELSKNSSHLTLTLHAPNSVYPGYDYQALGKIADRIIIMAYGYGSTPEPESQVEQAVEMACQSVPAHKLLLGISAPSETAESIAAKVGIAKRYNLGGVALWRLGLINNGMWQALRESLIANGKL